jgi:hypothetical protein
MTIIIIFTGIPYSNKILEAIKIYKNGIKINVENKLT